MTQPQMDLTNYLEFQISLLRLSTIPGPNGSPLTPRAADEAQQIQDIVGTLVPVRRSDGARA